MIVPPSIFELCLLKMWKIPSLFLFICLHSCALFLARCYYFAAVVVLKKHYPLSSVWQTFLHSQMFFVSLCGRTRIIKINEKKVWRWLIFFLVEETPTFNHTLFKSNKMLEWHFYSTTNIGICFYWIAYLHFSKQKLLFLWLLLLEWLKNIGAFLSHKTIHNFLKF